MKIALNNTAGALCDMWYWSIHSVALPSHSISDHSSASSSTAGPGRASSHLMILFLDNKRLQLSRSGSVLLMRMSSCTELPSLYMDSSVHSVYPLSSFWLCAVGESQLCSWFLWFLWWILPHPSSWSCRMVVSGEPSVADFSWPEIQLYLILTHCGLVTSYDDIDFGQLWLMAPSHYLNSCCLIFKGVLQNSASNSQEELMNSILKTCLNP